jgi:hypothetical protein
MSVVRLSINMDKDTVEEIKELDPTGSKSIASTVRNALTLFKFVLRMRKQGFDELVVRSSDGKKEKQILLP